MVLYFPSRNCFRVSRAPFWVAGLVFRPILGSTYTFWALFRFQWHTSPMHFGSFKVEVFRVQKSCHFGREKNSAAGSMLDSFWGFLLGSRFEK